MIKTERKEFARDSKTTALINTDKKSYESYKEEKARLNRLNNLENEVMELKTLLKKALDRIEKNGN